MGTASYISPEQAAGEPATPASDVYSFGVILFRMLTGQLPFIASSIVELIRLHQVAPPPNVADLRPGAPARLESVTAASLAKDPADRPQDGTALLAELGVAGAEARTTVLPTVPLAATPPASQRRPKVPFVVIGLALLVLVLAGIALALVVSNDSSGPAAPITTSSSLSLPSTGATTTPAPSTAATTTQPTTTAATTTAATTTAPPRTTAPTTTAPPPTTQPQTTAPATTTVDTTTPTTTAATTTQPPTPTQPAPGG